MPAGVLFVHNAFPGQFQHLLTALVARGVPCAGLGGLESRDMPGVRIARYRIPRSSTPGVYRLAMAAEGHFIRASMAFQVGQKLKDEGFDPAVIVGHAMWGEMALMAELFPHAKQVVYPEFFESRPRRTTSFDPEFHTDSVQELLVRKSRWAVPALELCDADAVVCPTAYQASRLPKAFQPLTRIIHEGVDLQAVRPAPARPLLLPDGTTIEPGTPVITHVNNYLEPARGLHILARALPRLLEAVPDAQVLIMGQHGKTSGYSGEAPDGATWKDLALRGVELDPARVRFLGHAEPSVLHEVLRLSTAHVYYTWPFVLSWSLVEAMALGCYIIGSDTEPLHDAIEDGVSGRLLPFFDIEALSDALIAACRDPTASAPLRAGARRAAEAKFDRAESEAAWFGLLREMGLEIPSAGA